MAAMLCLPFRKSVPLSLSSAIKQYISTKYDQHPDMFAADLAAIDKLRSEALAETPHYPGMALKLGRYAAQLQWIGGKFPIDIGADFTWYPALGYHTQNPITQNNLQFERANVIYNLASLYCRLANDRYGDSEEGLKATCNYLCAAAGVIKYLKDSVIPELRSTPPEDMDIMTLECLEQLLLAQAQECFWRKAAVDQRKDSVVARLAAKVSDFYGAACEFGMKSDSISSEWIHHMKAKNLHFMAVAQYRAACDCLDKSKYGEEVARLKHALEVINDGLKESRYLNSRVKGDLLGVQEKVTDTLKRAEKDNDLIYLSSVPPTSSLDKIQRAQMVSPKIPKEIEDANSMLSETGEYGAPLFAKLVPFAVHVASSIYGERRDRLVNNTIIDEMETLTAKLHDVLQSLNLPGSLQALEKPLGLPPGVVAHAEEVRQQEGVDRLRRSMKDIEKLKANDSAMYQEAVEMLNSEAAEDEKARAKHGTDRWTRDDSRTAAGKLIGQVDEYSGILKSADNSDGLVRDKLKDCEGILRLLEGDIHSLQEFVPNSSSPKLTPKMDREVGKLRQCLNEVSRLESRRRRKVESLREKAKGDDITTAILLEAARLERKYPLQKIEPAHFEPLFEQRLHRYDGDRAILADEIEEQEELVSRLKAANASFLAGRKVDSSLKEREQALQTLENGYLKYREIISNLDVGRKFYNDFAILLSRFRDACKHFVYQRRIEAGQIEIDITNAMSSLRISNPPIQPPTKTPSPQQQQQQQQQQRPPPIEAPLPAPVPTRAAVPPPSPGLWKGDATTAIRFGEPKR